MNDSFAESSYNGNKLLKRVDVAHNYTKEEILELDKCSKSCEYFITKYVKIVTIDDGLIHFNPYVFQKNIIESAEKSAARTIVKVGRQFGKTAIMSAIILWHVLFKDFYVVAICANKAKSAAAVLSKIKLSYIYLPKFLQQGIERWNTGDIELENGSKILTYATSADACRGEVISLLYLDELCFVPRNMQIDFFESVYPTISSGKTSKILVTSTPNGLDLFYKLWTEALEKNNGFDAIDVKWHDIPGRDEEWCQKTIDIIGKEAFSVEFECEFIGSSNTLISAETLKSIPHKDPISQRDALTIYQKPAAGHDYVMTVDTARGIGGDYSAFIIIDITSNPFEIVATYKDNLISPLLYPVHIQSAAKLYNDAFILIETNDLGEQVASILYTDLDCENILKTANSGRKGYILCSDMNSKAKYGVKTTKTTKAKGCSNLKSILENGKLIINDFEVLFELTNFIAVKNSYQADSGYNDDLAMCLVIFAWMVEQTYFKDLTNTNLRELIYSSKQKQEEEGILTFVMDNGLDSFKGDFEKVMIGNSPATVVSDYEDENYNWLNG